MASQSNIYAYHFWLEGKIVHTGITDDLERREQEHKQKYGKSGSIQQVNVFTTREAALGWEAVMRAQNYPTGP